MLAVAGSDSVIQPHLTLGRKTGSPVDTEKYMKPKKVLSMSLANNSSLGDVVFVCCNFFKIYCRQTHEA